MTATIRAIHVPEPGGSFVADRVDTPRPGPGHVRIAVEACGLCHSDVPIIDGYLPGTTFPMTPGHEIAGRIEAVGEQVDDWQEGQRVAVGYIAGTCGHCDACRVGDAINCPEAQVPGASYPGGFADAVVVPADALSRIPDQLSSADAAALACAGLSAFNGLRNSAARAGDVVAILGLGGVGHLGVQFAARMGFVTVAVARGTRKAEAAKALGADHYIDSTTQDVATSLQELGGAKVIFSTVTNAEATTSAIGGLRYRGELILVGYSPEDLQFNSLELIMGSKKIYGIISGTPHDREEAFRFAVQKGIRSWTELLPLEEAGAAYEKMLSGEARFRMVLTTGN
jgi:D-arabinose 1-dehydrogenase-like Zn-dependent alcohol dehydrogenase